ncbi:MAG: hypothetical protein COB15_01215 [Flavobacteriales bacterium]|nr:MAG: hypothetical protein COB15_01215 [Flavobacteriales bacterium]
MKKRTILFGGAVTLAFAIISCEESTEPFKAENKVESNIGTELKGHPYADNNGEIPSKEEYSNELYHLKYDYPDSATIDWSTPWTDFLNGKQISVKTSEGYMEILKERVRPGMSVLLNDAKKWNETRNDYNFYGCPWTSENVPKTHYSGRDAISGTYTGQIIDSAIFAKYGLTKKPIQNHALVYYNEVAAQTLATVWKDPWDPNYLNDNTQFEEGAIVIKAAGVTVSESEWPEYLKGCSTFDIYRPMIHDTTDTYVVQNLSYIQFDIIVKDSIASPETGWVFSTYIYDAKSTGETVYDRFTLLGVMWGLDPEVTTDGQELTETYINKDAPAFTEATLGFCGRLAGPIDIAVLVGPQTIEGGDPTDTVTYTPASSCLSCHGTAAFNSHVNFYPSPAPVDSIPPSKIYSPGSKEWMEWYVNKPGTEPQDKREGENIVAVDYGFVMMFALGNWAEITGLNNRSKKSRNFPSHK